MGCVVLYYDDLGRTVTYTYDATGDKLRNVSVINGVTSTTDYISGIQYKTGATAIDFIQTEEGKAVPTASGYDYYYYLGDNLGNTRVTFDTQTGSATSLQADNYYPFGMEINVNVSSPKNEYLYNKKELQEETQEYDYGARFYDPVIARWMTEDPLAIEYLPVSPYNYAINNPINVIDPDGNEVIGVTDEDAQKALQDTKAAFSDKKFDKFRALLKIGDDGKTFSKISPEDLAKALDGITLSDDDKASLAIVTNTINSSDKNEVEYVDKDGDLSESDAKMFVAKPLINAAAANGIGVSARFLQGSQTIQTRKGTYSIIPRCP